MASFVYICNLEDRNTAAGWEKTRYKSVAKWIAGTGATEAPIRSDSRPGLTTFCYKLPDGRQVLAERAIVKSGVCELIKRRPAGVELEYV